VNWKSSRGTDPLLTHSTMDVDHGPRTMDDGRWTMDHGRWTSYTAGATWYCSSFSFGSSYVHTRSVLPPTVTRYTRSSMPPRYCCEICVNPVGAPSGPSVDRKSASACVL